jgi:hypothetical protein
MRDIIFNFGNEVILVKIDGSNITFGNTSYGAYMAPISGLQLSYDGTILEYPDLKDDPSWREKAIERFKEKIKQMETEKEIEEYIINDLKRYGYIPKLRQIAGTRPEKL